MIDGGGPFHLTITTVFCMVHLLGRAGHLHQAEDMLKGMPYENDSVGWTFLLSTCENHGDEE